MLLKRFGFDVSFYQDINATPEKVDFQQMKDYGASFTIIKAGQYTYADEDFGDNWKNAKGILPRSAYWFCDKDDSGVAQARRFWELVKNDQPEGMLFADYEEGSWTDWNQLYAFLTELKLRSGYPSNRIGVYTGGYWYTHKPANQASLDWFKQFPLWLAFYTSNVDDVKIPLPWAEFLIWQDGTPAIGIPAGAESREIDHNWFNGDDNKFKEYLGEPPEIVVPPDTGVKMYKCNVLASSTPYINIRATPSSSGIDLGDMYPLEVFMADGIENDSSGRPWLHSIKDGKVGYVAAWLCAYEIVPEVADFPVRFIVEMNSGKIYESTDINEINTFYQP